MIEVSATGLALVVKASKTFPSGILITAFADDADPLDLPPTEIVKTGVDINGNLLSWSAPAPQTVTINVPAGSEEDQNLAILLDANTPLGIISRWLPLTATVRPPPHVTAVSPTAAAEALSPVRAV